MRSLLVAALVAAPFALGAAVAAPADDTAVGHEVTRFTDPDIIESSGLVVLGDDLAVTMNDSGDTARVFTVDLATGDTVGVTHFDGAAHDLESLAPADADHVWVGDTGDNGKDRPDITVTKVPVGRGDRTVEGETFHLTYPDGPHDAETLLAQPRTGRLFVVSKSPLGGAVYAAPAHLSATGTNILVKVASAPALATDGSFLPDGRHVLVRNYFKATVLTFPGWQAVADFTLPQQQQGEGLGVRADGTVFLSSEGADQPVLRIDLPASARAALAAKPVAPTSGPTTAASSPSAAPTPSSRPATTQHDSGSGGGVWVLALFGALGLLLLSGIVKLLRG
ncbi:hypothetical protein [Nocardioides jejuensis]|uniref:WD40 repeat domain-containing protein n=1 Tax=Nocardioides jejuensis TaxID=2502782 RepID=A0A4R1CK32_9ACTN|nr:hypothetical protein [Nocardioides jejuensis]TCJ30358.1 hypothetical protein EPD65_03910 [Nocardioides jejuensis]